MTDETAIANLLYRYAELMDLGDFDGAAELFAGARIRISRAAETGSGSDTDDAVHFVDAAGMLAIWKASVIRYPDGTPRTKHVTTNLQVEIDEATRTARARSYYTVLQQVDTLPLQPIIAGRYHDRFAFTDGRWRFVERDYTLVDLIGDLSRHLRIPL